ncbi:hypothetical protein ZHAS_00013881 [Anopheles sinensis]|uniref:Uncharacterized protein n=1 Tax=Anopheles sinensis TaxID=74873 RepID=A0A084W6S4_ANOSI|nr:hypothetical protein ZHAS_00013881 [Anopheles sinensis]
MSPSSEFRVIGGGPISKGYECGKYDHILTKPRNPFLRAVDLVTFLCASEKGFVATEYESVEICPTGVVGTTASNEKKRRRNGKQCKREAGN